MDEGGEEVVGKERERVVGKGPVGVAVYEDAAEEARTCVDQCLSEILMEIGQTGIPLSSCASQLIHGDGERTDRSTVSKRMRGYSSPPQIQA